MAPPNTNERRNGERSSRVRPGQRGPGEEKTFHRPKIMKAAGVTVYNIVAETTFFIILFYRPTVNSLIFSANFWLKMFL